MGLTPAAEGIIRGKGEPCFHCSSLINEDPCIYWMGEIRGAYGRMIFLHIPCAIELCTRIMRDVHEVQCKYHLDVTLARRWNDIVTEQLLADR